MSWGPVLEKLQRTNLLRQESLDINFNCRVFLDGQVAIAHFAFFGGLERPFAMKSEYCLSSLHHEPGSAKFARTHRLEADILGKCTNSTLG